MRNCLRTLCLTCAFAAAAFAQQSRATIIGRTTDQTGASKNNQDSRNIERPQLVAPLYPSTVHLNRNP